MNSYLIEPERVKLWADLIPSDEFIGWPGQPASCPLAHYLNDAYPSSNKWCVGLSEYWIQHTGIEEFLPEWARRVIHEIDLCSPREEITAGQFRVILAKVLKI